MPSQIIGRVQPVNQGNYDATRAYVVLDRVKFQGAWYECQADATAGIAPETGGNAYWMEIGVKGDAGQSPQPVWDGTELHFEYSDGTSTQAVDLQGPQGIQGEQGRDGQTPPLTSDLTSTAPDVALSALGGKRLKDAADAAAAAASTAATTTALGRSRLATPAEVRAGAAAADSVEPAVVAVGDIKNAGALMTCNTRVVLTASGSFIAPVSGWYKIICIGGGGGGGGSGLFGGGTYSPGCGGGAGYVTEGFFYLTAGQSYSVNIGAGGTAGAAVTAGGKGGTTSFASLLSADGGNGGTAEYTGVYPNNRGGKGFGNGEGAHMYNEAGTGHSIVICGGNGGSNGTAFGGGGGGAGMIALQHPSNPGYGGPNAFDGATGTVNNAGAAGGAGGSGAVILEYFDYSKAA